MVLPDGTAVAEFDGQPESGAHPDVSRHIREVTPAEVASYEENGWVKLDGLVSRDLAGEMLETAKSFASEERHWQIAPEEWIAFGVGPRGVEPFRSLVFSPQMGRNAHLLINRSRLTDDEVPIRYRVDILGCRGSAPERLSPYHQDSAEHGSDRIGELQFWLALDEVTPDMGSMRFLSGAHREGPLGSSMIAARDILATYPKLLDLYELSPPCHYQPGDVTVHHGHMVHGAPPNLSGKLRWYYLFSYTPADTRYFEGSTSNKGSLRTEVADTEKHPIVYSPGDTSPARPLSAR